nr:MAG TPA: hypothetical protein [Caudoviricetes sp.]
MQSVERLQLRRVLRGWWLIKQPTPPEKSGAFLWLT